MSEFVEVPDVAMFELRFQLYGQKIENTLYFREALSWSSASLLDQCEALYVWWNSRLREQMSVSLGLYSIAGTSLQTPEAPAVEFTLPTPVFGEQIQTAMPGNVAITVTFKTNQRGRSFTGRNYISGIPSNQVVGNTVDVNWCADLAAAYNAILTDVPEILGTWVVVSRFHNKAPRAVGLDTAVRNAVMTDNHIDSQRRRLNGRGE